MSNVGERTDFWAAAGQIWTTAARHNRLTSFSTPRRRDESSRCSRARAEQAKRQLPERRVAINPVYRINQAKRPLRPRVKVSYAVVFNHLDAVFGVPHDDHGVECVLNEVEKRVHRAGTVPLARDRNGDFGVFVPISHHVGWSCSKPCINMELVIKCLRSFENKRPSRRHVVFGILIQLPMQIENNLRRWRCLLIVADIGDQLFVALDSDGSRPCAIA